VEAGQAVSRPWAGFDRPQSLMVDYVDVSVVSVDRKLVKDYLRSAK
jgi:hypothetical protein